MQKKHLLEYLFVVSGALSLSCGTVALLAPNEVITGGGIGIALLIHHVCPQLTLGTYIVIVSTPFIIIGYVYFGKKFTLKTFLTMILISSFTDIQREILEVKPFVEDILLGSIFGGAFIGFGIGLIIRGKSSTGSTSVVGEIISHKTKFKVSEVLLTIDAIILLSSILVYGDVKKSLYSLLGVYVTGRVVDVVLTGRPSKKIVNVVSNNIEELSGHIREEIAKYGTIVSGIGLQRGTPRHILFVAVESSKIQQLRDIVATYDPEAFLIISEASEILGRGMTS